MSIEEIRISQSVTAGNEECETYIPPNGKDFTVLRFVGDSAFTSNATVRYQVHTLIERSREKTSTDLNTGEHRSGTTPLMYVAL